MRITEFEWHEENIEHIAHHGVDAEEVEDICFSPSCHVQTGRGGLYYAAGQTQSGRYLLIVLKYLGHGRARVITARDMDSAEKARYKKQRGL